MRREVVRQEHVAADCRGRPRRHVVVRLVLLVVVFAPAFQKPAPLEVEEVSVDQTDDDSCEDGAADPFHGFLHSARVFSEDDRGADDLLTEALFRGERVGEDVHENGPSHDLQRGRLLGDVHIAFVSVIDCSPD